MLSYIGQMRQGSAAFDHVHGADAPDLQTKDFSDSGQFEGTSREYGGRMGIQAPG